MEIEGLTLDQFAEKVGASGRNWAFRFLAHDGESKYSGTKLDDPLMRVIDWVGFAEGLVCGGAEPGKESDTYWGDIRAAIYNCVDIPEEVRGKLWEVVQSWAGTVEHYDRQIEELGAGDGNP